MKGDQIISDMFPATTPKTRGNRDVPWKIGFGVFCLLMGCCLTKANLFSYLSGSTVCAYLLVAYIEFGLRTCNLLEEYHHLESRYKNSYAELLLANYVPNALNMTFIVVAHICGVFMYEFQGGLDTCITNWGVTAFVCSLAAVLIFTKLTQIEYSMVNTSKIMDELKGLDCGSVLAHGFLHGYLNLILPDKGDDGKGLAEQISDYASKNRVDFVTKKLYILIPLSGHCPPMINLASNGYIENAGSLDWRRINRAGVSKRQYHNSVYKLWPEKDFKQPPLYICAEYASPLATLKEIMRRNTHHQLQYEKFHYDIVTNFYMTLSKILKSDPSFYGLYELVYYRDIDNDGNTLTKDQFDVGKMLLDHINRH